MKALVKKDFVDKINRVLCKSDDIVEVTKERFDEINKAKHGPFIEEVKKPKKVGD